MFLKRIKDQSRSYLTHDSKHADTDPIDANNDQTGTQDNTESMPGHSQNATRVARE